MISYANPASFAQPDRVVFPANWIGHIPFAFWLVDQMRPNLLVELGTHSGNSFCAFAQAGMRWSPETRFVAVDHWEGDDQAGKYSKSVLDDLKRYLERYPDLDVTLEQKSFDEARPAFADASIDILHIDGLHTYEAVRHDFETWLPCMSDSGVILLHDAAVFRDGFGVARLVSEIARDFPCCVLLHSHGLAVVQVGSNVPEAVERLVRGERDDTGMEASAVFARLGNDLLRKYFVAESLDTAAATHRILNSVQADIREPQELHLAPEVSDRIVASEWFDSEYYRSQGGRGDDGEALFRDYLARGEALGLRPSAGFDPVYYLSANPDVAAAGLGALVHFICYGEKEGRLPGPKG